MVHKERLNEVHLIVRLYEEIHLTIWHYKMEPVFNNCRPYHLSAHVAYVVLQLIFSISQDTGDPSHSQDFFTVYPSVMDIISILKDVTQFVWTLAV